MQFNEIVDRDGVERISDITNISIDNLNNLVEENFEKLTRVKSLGFLLILEREYHDIDVSQLRERVKIYFEENRPADENVVMIHQDARRGDSFSFFKWFIVGAIFAGGLYLYTNNELDELIDNIEDKKDFFDDNRALESNTSDKEANNVLVENGDGEKITIITPIEPTEKKISLISDESKKDINSTESVVEEVIKSADSIVKKTVEEVVNNSKDNQNSTSSDSKISTITVNPTRGNLWFGFINLDSKKRREFMKKTSTPFDIEGGRWLLVTGHGFVDIVSDIKTIELADSKKHYFYIDDKDIRTLTKREFRHMNGRRGW